MRFLAITPIVHAPHPATGERKSTRERFREVIGNAVLAEPLGFDGFGVTEKQHIEALELFQSDIAPTPRRDIPDPPWPWGPSGVMES